MARYRSGGGPDETTGRLYAPTFLRNSPPLIATLAPYLSGATGRALEIGSGTGQHAAALSLAFGGLAWQPTDIDPIHRQSVAAWATHLGAHLPPALNMDASQNWATRDDISALGPFRAIVAMNVIHIAPVAVLDGILAGAAATLQPGGQLIFCGPFIENGQHTGAGNAAFDAGLRAEDPSWGLRDIAHITADAENLGLTRRALITMPANNRVLILQR